MVEQGCSINFVHCSMGKQIFFVLCVTDYINLFLVSFV